VIVVSKKHLFLDISSTSINMLAARGPMDVGAAVVSPD
jgi:hypothetical protein